MIKENPRITSSADSMIWGEATSGIYSVKSGYEFITQLPIPHDSNPHWKVL